MITGKKVLVFTDRYPPFAEGGAEISLHALLKPLAESGNLITVVAFDEAAQERMVSHFEGINVHKIPYSSEWPSAKWRSRHIGENKKPRFFWRVFRKMKYISDYALRSKEESGFLNRLRRVGLKFHLQNKRLGEYIPMGDKDISDVPDVIACLEEIIQTIKPDLIHADNFRSILLASRLNASIPIVAQVRDNRFFCARKGQPVNIDGQICISCAFECLDRLPENLIPILKRSLKSDLDFRRMALGRADRVVVTSQFLFDQVAAFIDPDKLRLVSNAVGDIEIVQKYETLDVAKPPEILVVGMINENKGQIHISAWLGELSRRVGDFRIVVAGRGQGVGGALKRAVAKLGYSDRVLFTGYLSREELYRSYARATVVVCPNIWPEPFGRVPLEAGIAAKPVVAYGSGGILESIINNKTGILVNPGDERGLIDGIVRVINDKELASYLGKNARGHILERFPVGRSVEMLSECWESVMFRKSSEA